MGEENIHKIIPIICTGDPVFGLTGIKPPKGGHRYSVDDFELLVEVVDKVALIVVLVEIQSGWQPEIEYLRSRLSWIQTDHL